MMTHARGRAHAHYTLLPRSAAEEGLFWATLGLGPTWGVNPKAVLKAAKVHLHDHCGGDQATVEVHGGPEPKESR